MADCKQLLFLIKQSPEGEATAMKMILQDKQYQRAAYNAHQHYEKIHAITEWEDIFYDAVIRFVHMVKRKEEKKQDLSFDCLVYFKTICRNICSEYARQQRILDPRFFDLFELPKDLIPEFSESMAEKLMRFFNQLNEKCQTLLEARFLWTPQEKDKKILSELIDHKVKPTAISTTINRCKKDLAEIIGENLDDLLNS